MAVLADELGPRPAEDVGRAAEDVGRAGEGRLTLTVALRRRRPARSALRGHRPARPAFRRHRSVGTAVLGPPAEGTALCGPRSTAALREHHHAQPTLRGHRPLRAALRRPHPTGATLRGAPSIGRIPPAALRRHCSAAAGRAPRVTPSRVALRIARPQPQHGDDDCRDRRARIPAQRRLWPGRIALWGRTPCRSVLRTARLLSNPAHGAEALADRAARLRRLPKRLQIRRPAIADDIDRGPPQPCLSPRRYPAANHPLPRHTDSTDPAPRGSRRHPIADIRR